jgi:hypothetical protein
VPLDRAADCLSSLRDRLYGSEDLARAFRAPGLVRCPHLPAATQSSARTLLARQRCELILLLLGQPASPCCELQVRFVAGERAYLSNSHGGPRMYVNIEDYLSHATGRVNKEFQVSGLAFAPLAGCGLSWYSTGWAVWV